MEFILQLNEAIVTVLIESDIPQHRRDDVRSDLRSLAQGFEQPRGIIGRSKISTHFWFDDKLLDLSTFRLHNLVNRRFLNLQIGFQSASDSFHTEHVISTG